MLSRLHVYINGYVQGVGFRYSTCQEARVHNLAGWVRNLPDGRVEAEFEGSQHDLEAMLSWCHVGPNGAEVSLVEAEWEHNVAPKYTAFGFDW